MRVALVHYWLVNMRGGERVLESLCRMFPDADIYTHVVDRSKISRTLASHNITETFIGRLPFAKRWYQKYLPLMPWALEALDLSEYDIIISSESGPAKGIIPPPDGVHISYVHSPMRYIWDKYHVYRSAAGRLARLMMLPIAHYMRIWDTASATRVDLVLANSTFVSKRIDKYWKRNATVVFPPVAVSMFHPVAQEDIEDYYLWVGEMVIYKRPDLAIEAFRRNGRKLIVIGDGPERKVLERTAPPNITFMGKIGFTELKRYMATCRALIFPGDEDFGIIPVEVQASGRPVIAYGRGGVLDTVIDGRTGVLYTERGAEGLVAAVERFEASDLVHSVRDACVANASRFSETVFQDGIRAALVRCGVVWTPSTSLPEKNPA